MAINKKDVSLIFLNNQELVGQKVIYLHLVSGPELIDYVLKENYIPKEIFASVTPKLKRHYRNFIMSSQTRDLTDTDHYVLYQCWIGEEKYYQIPHIIYTKPQSNYTYYSLEYLKYEYIL